jgi:tryptophan synthase alpha chain
MAAELADNRLVAELARARSRGRKTLLPFVTAGYPDLPTTLELLRDFQRRGVRVCELGVPFSDPIADGAVIQASYTDALARGVESRGIFDVVRQYRAAGGDMALVAMVSYSIVFRCGVGPWVADAAAAGFDGLIVPDLPLEEAASLEPLTAGAGLCNIMLIAPNTQADRRRQIASHSRGFIYFISVAGTTGERSSLPAATIAAVGELRAQTTTPICVGFGIARPEMVRTVCEVADGAIVGSAIIHRIADAAKANLPRQQIVSRAGEFVSHLLSALD